MAEGLSGAEGATTGSSGQSNSSLNIGADLASETIVPTEREKAVFRALMGDTFLSTPESFVTWMADRVVQQGIPVSISQIIGFTQFTAQPATTITTAETTASTSYTDLATVGPTLTGLSDGQYLLLFGGAANDQASTGLYSSFMSVSVNAAAAADADATIGGSNGDNFTLARAVVKTLNNDGNNTVTAKYKVAGSTFRFQNRWLIAIKYSNA